MWQNQTLARLVYAADTETESTSFDASAIHKITNKQD
jgi:hypothetical protein